MDASINLVKIKDGIWLLEDTHNGTAYVVEGTEKAVEMLAEKLEAKGVPEVVVTDLARSDMAEAVEDAFRYDTVVFATTTFNNGIFPFMTKQRMMNRTSSFWVGQYGETDVVGYKSQFTHIYPEDTGSFKSLFKTEKGEGINPGFKDEGIREAGFAGTYLLGPLFVLNPVLMKEYLAEMGYKDIKPLYEETAVEAYNKRLAEYREPGRSYKY